MKRKREIKDLLLAALTTLLRVILLVIDHFRHAVSHFSSRHIKRSLSCRLERRTKGGNEAGNGTTEIGTHGEGGVDLTGVKIEEDLVGHVVHTEVLTEIWIETDEEGQVCLPIKIIYWYLLIL